MTQRSQIAESHESPAAELAAERDALATQLARVGGVLSAAAASGSLEELAYRGVDEVRRRFGVDRVSLATQRGGNWRIAAISGADEVDPKSRLARCMAAAVSEAARLGEGLFHHDGRDGQIGPALDELVHESGAKHCGVVLVRAGAESGDVVVGALIGEQFQTSAPGELEARLTGAALLLGPPLTRALLDERTPLVGILRRTLRPRLERRSAGVGRWILIAVVATAVVAACLAPIPFRVRAEGRSQPEARSHVFTPENAVIEQVLVRHNQTVAQGDVLMVLASPELEQELEQVEGELETVREQIAAARVMQFDEASPSRRGGGEPASVLRELAARQAALEAELALLRARRDSMTVRSPQAGRVLTWDADRLLAQRPVNRGQRLMTIGDPSGAWLLELDVAPGRAAYLPKEDAVVEFISTASPAETREARVRRVAAAAHELEEGVAVRVEAIVDAGSTTGLTPGGAVAAKIACGRRSAAFGWLHEAIDSLRARLFL